MVEIVPARPEDAAVILAIQLRAFAEEGRLSEKMDIPPLLETVAGLEAQIRSQTVVVAKVDGVIVGSARGLLNGTVCTIRGVLVEPTWHGRGIGGTLLAAIEALHPHVTRFELTTNTLVPGNVQFYERRGYRVHELSQYTEKIVLAQMRKAGPAA